MEQPSSQTGQPSSFAKLGDQAKHLTSIVSLLVILSGFALGAIANIAGGSRLDAGWTVNCNYEGDEVAYTVRQLTVLNCGESPSDVFTLTFVVPNKYRGPKEDPEGLQTSLKGGADLEYARSGEFNTRLQVKPQSNLGVGQSFAIQFMAATSNWHPDPSLSFVTKNGETDNNIYLDPSLQLHPSPGYRFRIVIYFASAGLVLGGAVALFVRYYSLPKAVTTAQRRHDERVEQLERQHKDQIRDLEIAHQKNLTAAKTDAMAQGANFSTAVHNNEETAAEKLKNAAEKAITKKSSRGKS